jgi:hypothetical protein
VFPILPNLDDPMVSKSNPVCATSKMSYSRGDWSCVRLSRSAYLSLVHTMAAFKDRVSARICPLDNACLDKRHSRRLRYLRWFDSMGVRSHSVTVRKRWYESQ